MTLEESEVRISKSEGGTYPNSEQPATGGTRSSPGRIIFPVIIGVLLVASVALFAKTRSQAGKLEEAVRAGEISKELAAGLKRDLSDRLRELNNVSDQLRLAEADRDQLREEAVGLNASRNQLQEEAVGLHASRNQLQARVEDLREQNRNLDRQLRAEQASLARLREEFRKYREDQKRPLDQTEEPRKDIN